MQVSSIGQSQAQLIGPSLVPRFSRLKETLSRDWLEGLDYPIAFADREYLICFDVHESFNLLRGWPLHFHRIHGLSLPQPKVKPQVAL